MLRFCFNERMGFTNTVNTLLGSTNYELKLSGDGYLFDGKVLPFKTRTATFKIKQADGSLKFVGIEFVVPLSESATPPSLFGLEFHRNEAFQLWVLHVWLYKENPSGMFSDWNPTVSCAAVS